MRVSQLWQGWKGLASRLHPPLPLNPKESQQLLNVLKTSFRDHLDEVHPKTATERSKKSTEPPSEHADRGSNLSAVASADTHLASILANPLFLRGGKDVSKPATSDRDFQGQLTRDPLRTLEEFHSRGAASLRLAETCLSSFKRRVDPLSKAERQVLLSKHQPGRRALQWVKQSQIFRSRAYFLRSELRLWMTQFLVEEDEEECLWDWLSDDIDLSNSDHSQSHESRNLWKSLVPADLVTCKLHCPDEALISYLRYDDLREAAEKTRDAAFPLARMALHSLLRHIRRTPRSWAASSPRLFDRFLQALIRPGFDEPSTTCGTFEAACAQMHHPDSSRSTALPAFTMLKEFFGTSEGPAKTTSLALLHPELLHTVPSSHRHRPGEVLCDVVLALEREERFDDAEWLFKKAQEAHPDADLSVEKRDLQQMQTRGPHEQELQFEQDATLAFS